jgi:hypothetical protein
MRLPRSWAGATLATGFVLLASSCGAANSQGGSDRGPEFLGDGPTYADEILHVAYRGRDFATDGPDPFNGLEVEGDIWIEVGPDGNPRRLFAHYRLPDGSLVQAVYASPEESRLYLGKPGSTSPTNCSTADQSALPVTRLRAYMPIYLETDELYSSGFVDGSSIRPRQLSGSRAPAAGEPTASESLDAESARGFSRSESTADTATEQEFVISSSGRMIASFARSASVDGLVVVEREQWYGDLERYGASATDVFPELLESISCE